MRLIKCLLTAISLCFVLGSAAQFKEGDRMVGASVASAVYTSGNADISVAQIGNNSSKSTNYSLTLSPSMGWFISANTVIGGTLTINPYGNKITYEQNGSTYQSDKYNNFNIGIGGFIRQYLKNQGKMMPFGQFGFNVGLSSLKTEGFFYGGSAPNAYKLSYDGSSNGGFFANASLQGGFTKMVGESAGLDFFIGYTYGYNKNTFAKTTLRDNGNDGTVDETLKNETTTKFTSHGFQLGVGFQVFLRKKK